MEFLKNLKDMNVCGKSPEALISQIENFHSHVAPGLVLGAFMVDMAQQLIGPGIEADAVVETNKCLPDAIQIFTPCTIGNGWLTVLDWHKFALTLYDKKTLLGHRVSIDLENTKKFPNLYNWYMNRVTKKELPLETLLKSIFEAGHAALSHAPVTITRLIVPEKKQVGICPVCREAYPMDQGENCLACQGDGYYKTPA